MSVQFNLILGIDALQIQSGLQCFIATKKHLLHEYSNQMIKEILFNQVNLKTMDLKPCYKAIEANTPLHTEYQVSPTFHFEKKKKKKKKKKKHPPTKKKKKTHTHTHPELGNCASHNQVL